MMRWYLISLATAAVAIVIAMAAVPGPNDRRYPDWVVDPRVECVKEGVFPHPRNCSWYYRCVDRMNIGFFFTYYFECEPETVFADDLDQCVFPFLTSPPCGTGTGATPTGTNYPIDTTPSLPTPGPVEPDETGSPNSITTTPEPTTTDLFSETDNEGETTTATPDVDEQITGGPVIFPCLFHDDNCIDYEICSPVRKTQSLCSACNVGAVVITSTAICSDENMVIDKSLMQCVPLPDSESLCAATTTTTTIAPTPKPVTVGGIFTFECSDSQTRPNDDWILRRYCESYALCTPEGNFKGMKRLCSNFYQCYKNDGAWTWELRHCVGDNLFSFEADACVARPGPDELCTF